MEHGKNKRGRPLKKPSPWSELYICEGGEAKLAAKLGVAKSTIGKWADGVHRIPQMAKKELLRLCKNHGIREGIEEFKSR